ncbi:MAG: radical SAM protein [Lachnospiraceae bacterium]|nr:radical SAM protein [Lachnospiraceae bacterium]
MKKLVMERVSCHVTERCNLRCKMCSAFIPKLYELGNVPEYDMDDIKNSFKTYFNLVERVRMISISGGEPMLHPRLVELLEFLLQYEEAYAKLEIFTNGTLIIPEPVLEVMSKSEKMSLFIDHYGPQISTKIEEIKALCEKYHVKYKIRIYYGEDMHMGGWTDRSFLTEKLCPAKAKEHFNKCFSSNMFTIFGKYMAFCPMPYIGHNIGAIPESDVLGMSLADDETTLEEKYAKLVEISNVDFNPGCAWCNGLGIYENVERFVPGEQVRKE